MSKNVVAIRSQRILLSFTGFHDPFASSGVAGSEQEGPVLSLVRLRPFDIVYLFSTPATVSNSEATVAALSKQHPQLKVETCAFTFGNPTDYFAILAALRDCFKRISDANAGAEYYIGTASGTPQMHACWVMLASTGEIPARILQARPPQFVSTDRPAVQEVDLRAFALSSHDLHMMQVLAMSRVQTAGPPGRAGGALKELAPAPRTVLAELREELEIIGEHELFLGALERAASFAEHSAPVLIMGETGTGKELVARLVHRISGRPVEKFVAVNCAALPASLAESLLFGHRKGAFTGAAEDQKGKFVQAHGGTLFLDEIGELPPEVQAKLLRVLQDGVVEPIGASTGTRVNVRIIAATNRKLREEVKEKRFREDLFYRIEVGTVSLPPLRERRTDIPLLALWGLGNINSRLKNPKRLSKEALQRLQGHDWPGNVRSLMNVIERAAISVRGEVIGAGDIQLSEEESARAAAAAGAAAPGFLPEPAEGFRMDEFLDQARRHLLTRALDMANGNKTVAARLLGITPQAIHNFLRRDRDPAQEG